MLSYILVTFLIVLLILVIALVIYIIINKLSQTQGNNELESEIKLFGVFHLKLKAKFRNNKK